MLIPVVPFVEGIKVKNKKIIYSDELAVRDDATSIYYIENVDEDSIEKCIKDVFRINSGVVFERIQYSINDACLYFYTNNEIRKEVISEDKLLASKVRSEFEKILHQKRLKDTDCVSLNDILYLITYFNEKYEKLKRKYTKVFRKCVEVEDCEYINSIEIKDFDYEKNVLVMNIYDSEKEEVEIFFSEDEFLAYPSSIVEVNTDILFYQNYFREAFNDFLKLKKFMLDKGEKIKSVNTKFLIEIDKDGIDISFKDEDRDKFRHYFYDYLEWFGMKDEEIFGKIFVKISDCPIYLQKKLYESRQLQLEEEYRLKNKQMKRIRKK